MLWEYLISWIKPRTPEWEQRARAFHINNYVMFGSRQWQAYEKDEYHLLDTKIYRILYDLSNCGSITGYIVNQYLRNVTNKIRKTIVYVHKTYSHVSTLRIGVMYLYCKGTYKEFYLPIFRVYTSDKDDECLYVDMHCRIYDSWLSWKNDNKLPMLKYCYPLNGSYTCYHHANLFDRKLLEVNSSPACKLVARLGRMLDVSSGIARYTNEFVGLISLFTSLDPIKTMFAGVVGVAGAVYGAARSVQRLIDKNRHEMSPLDAESLMHGLNILMILPHVTIALVNNPLTLRYHSQAIFPWHILTTSAQKIRSFTVFQRLGLIVLTVILHQKISAYLNMTHSNANKLIDILKQSTENFDTIKHVIINELFDLGAQRELYQSMNMPNKVDAKTRKTSKNNKSVVHNVRTEIKEKCLMKFELQSNNLFAKFNVTDKNLIQATTAVISKLKCKHVGPVVHLIELERAGKSKSEYRTFLSELQTVSNTMEQFVYNIKKDCKEVKSITKQMILKFSNDYTAVYHYRKHRAEFGSNTSMKLYLCDIPQELFQNKYLYSYEYDENKKLKTITFTNINGFQYGVLKQEKEQVVRIATIYKNEKFFQNWKIKWKKAREKLSTIAYDKTKQQLGRFHFLVCPS